MITQPIKKVTVEITSKDYFTEEQAEQMASKLLGLLEPIKEEGYKLKAYYDTTETTSQIPNRGKE